MSQLSFESLFLADQADLQPRASAPARMLSPAEARKQFASVPANGENMRRSEVFSDFITLAASELDLARFVRRRTSKTAVASAHGISRTI
jgi:hypothetical protein